MYRPTPERDGRFGFTLIELLIVVAIIAILAAIAIPNFLEAQTRSRVSRAKGDLRTLAIALDSYFIDHSKYCKDSSPTLDVDQASGGSVIPMLYADGFTELTTPIAYMSSILNDPFERPVYTGTPSPAYILGSGDWSYPTTVAANLDGQDSYQTFNNHGTSEAYVVISVGPDTVRNAQSYKCFPWRPESAAGATTLGTMDTTNNPGSTIAYYLDYDPTNGTVSLGDVQRFGGDFLSGDWNRYYQNADGSGSGPGGSGT
jgi:prepilin-type N-terminal cleavage/methylation domain-containing protein